MHEEDHPMPQKKKRKRKFFQIFVLEKIKEGKMPKRMSMIVENNTTDTMEALHFSSSAPAGDGSLANEPHNLLSLQGLDRSWTRLDKVWVTWLERGLGLRTNPSLSPICLKALGVMPRAPTMFKQEPSKGPRD